MEVIGAWANRWSEGWRLHLVFYAAPRSIGFLILLPCSPSTSRQLTWLRFHYLIHHRSTWINLLAGADLVRRVMQKATWLGLGQIGSERPGESWTSFCNLGGENSLGNNERGGGGGREDTKVSYWPHICPNVLETEESAWRIWYIFWSRVKLLWLFESEHFLVTNAQEWPFLVAFGDSSCDYSVMTSLSDPLIQGDMMWVPSQFLKGRYCYYYYYHQP